MKTIALRELLVRVVYYRAVGRQCTMLDGLLCEGFFKVWYERGKCASPVAYGVFNLGRYLCARLPGIVAAVEGVIAVKFCGLQDRVVPEPAVTLRGVQEHPGQFPVFDGLIPAVSFRHGQGSDAAEFRGPVLIGNIA